MSWLSQGYRAITGQTDPKSLQGYTPGQVTYQPWQQGQFTTNLQKQLESRYQGLTPEERAMYQAQFGEMLSRQQAMQRQGMGEQIAQMGLSGSGIALAQQRALASQIAGQQGGLMREMELGGMQRGMQAMQMGSSLTQALEGLGLRQAGMQAEVGMFNVGQQSQADQMLAMMQNQAMMQNRMNVGNFWSGLLGGGMNLYGNIKGASILAGALSDIRFKENIRRIGKLDNGLPVYSFNFKGSNVPQIGLIAQEVEKVIPEAVTELNGIKYVNYDLATKEV